METESRFLVVETLLTRRPHPLSSTVTLLSLLALCLFSGLYWEKVEPIYRYLSCSKEQVTLSHEYWRLLTTIGVHGDVVHLLSNSIFFSVLAYHLYGYYGARVFPWMTLGLGAIVNYLALISYEQNVVLVGASGVVYLMAGFWLSLYVLIQRKLSLRRRILRCVGFSLILLLPASFKEEVSYRTHFFGFVVGIGWGLTHFFYRWREIRAAEVCKPDLDLISET